jgi:hypothetical protein
MTTTPPHANVGDMVLIAGGISQWRHGLVVSVDATSFERPFAIVHFVGSRGRICKTRRTLVPLRHLAPFDVAVMRENAKRKKRAVGVTLP